MTQEEKQLLFKDLSTRLPYHVKVKVWLKYGTTEEGVLDFQHNYADVLQDAFYYSKIKGIKPYLRPMSSMTEEERKEYNEYLFHGASIGLMSNTETAYELIDWLNVHHFDYRDLIPMGLALEAPEGMYKH